MMIQSIRRDSYGARRLFPSCHAPASVSRSHSRLGFTLVEVVVAFAILFILLIGLLGFYGRSLTTSRRTQVTETAENLAELQVEDIRSLSVYLLKSLVSPGLEREGTDASGNPIYTYIPASSGFTNDNYPLDQAVSSTAESSTDGNTVYDSGWQASDFVLSGIESVVVGGISYTVSGPNTNPSSALTLPASITVSPDPSSATYDVTVMKETFPHLEKRILVRLVRDGQRDASGNEIDVPANAYQWPSGGESSFVFSYSVTVRWAENAQDMASGKYRSVELSGMTGEGIVENSDATP